MRAQNSHTSLFREARNIKSFDRKCSKTNTTFTAGSFLETINHTKREEWVPPGSVLCVLQNASSLSVLACGVWNGYTVVHPE